MFRDKNLTVAKCLDLISAQVLFCYAHLLTGKEHEASKNDTAQLIDTIVNQSALTLWKRLTELERLAVAETINAPKGKFDKLAFGAKYGEVPPGLTQNVSYSRKEHPPLIRLFLYSDTGAYHIDHLIVPTDLKETLQPVLPKLEAMRLKCIDNLPKFIKIEHGDAESRTQKLLQNRRTEQAALHELQVLLRLVDAGKIVVSDRTLLPVSATTSEIATHLVGGDFYPPDTKSDPSQQIGSIRSYGWAMLLLASELAAAQTKKLALTKAGLAALNSPPSHTLRDIWWRWQRVKDYDELQRIDQIRGQKKDRKGTVTAPSMRRTVVAFALRQCPTNKWIRYDEFSRYMRASGSSFDIVNAAYDLYTVNPGDGTLWVEGRTTWEILQDRYMLCLFFEYLATLGIIDVAYVDPIDARRNFDALYHSKAMPFLSRYDGLQYFRINPLGAFCLGITETYNAATPEYTQPALTVLSSLQIKSSSTLSLQDQLLMETFAESEAENSWRLVRQKAVAAVRRGHDIERLRDFLQAGDDQPLPETVEAFIDLAKRNANAFKLIGTVNLIECIDTKTADSVAAHKMTAALCTRSNERHLLVKPEDLGAFAEALHLLGYGLNTELCQLVKA